MRISLISVRKRSVYVILALSSFIFSANSVVSGFDPHHDGLVLNTIRFTKFFMFQGGEIPFNQYGIFWSFFMTVLTFPVPDQYLFLSLRVFSLLFYIISASLLFKISKLSGLKVPNGTLLVMIILYQPWWAGKVATFLPWPSALSGVLLCLLTYLSLKDLLVQRKPSRALIIGVTLACLLLTRTQVGLLAIFVTILIGLLEKSLRQLILVISGFVMAILPILFFVIYRNQVDNVAFDSITYGFSYVQDQYDVNPKPFFTFGVAILTIMALFAIRLDDKIILTFERFFRFRSRYFLTAVFLLISGTLTIYSRELTLIDIVYRRLLIGTFLGTFFFFAIKILLKTLSRKRYLMDRVNFYLLLFSCVGIVQVYPQFDQTHLFWGMFPGVLLVLEQITRRFSIMHSGFVILSRYTVFLITFVFVIVPSIESTFAHKNIYPESSIRGIVISDQAVSKTYTLQSFFKQNLAPGSRVLNLCHTSTVFFNTEFQTASRFFMYWPPFIDSKEITHQILHSRPDRLITCSQTQIPAAAEATVLKQNQFIELLGFDRNQPRDSITVDGTFWAIY